MYLLSRTQSVEPRGVQVEDVEDVAGCSNFLVRGLFLHVVSIMLFLFYCYFLITLNNYVITMFLNFYLLIIIICLFFFFLVSSH